MSLTNRKSVRAGILAASAIALVASSPVLAQAQVDELIVTAQRVKENVQDVPIGISVLTAGRLEQTNVFDVASLNRIVPSVTFRKGTNNSGSALLIRGVGTVAFAIGTEPSVSTVVDGVVLSRSGQAFIDLVDVERLEVLRGPQGTLFGKNASAGLINIVSRGGTDQLEAEARADWFEGNEYRLRASLSGPLANGLTARLTGFYNSFDGNITNVFEGRNEKVNGYERYGARGILDYDSGTARLRLIADYMRSNDDCCADVTAVSRGAVLDAELALPGGVAQGEDQRFVNHNLVTRAKGSQWSLTANGDFDVLTDHVLSVVAGFRDFDQNEIREGDFLPRAIVGTQQLHDNGFEFVKQYSLEVRLASDQTKKFFYQIGALAWRADYDNTFTRQNIGCSTSNLPLAPSGARPCDLNDRVNTIFPTATGVSDVNSRNYAVFGQATYRLTDKLSVIGGLRFTRDTMNFTHTRAPSVNTANGVITAGQGLRVDPAGGFISAGGNGTNVSTNDTSANNLSGRGVLQYAATDDVMFYASYTRGYKGPAFNVFFNHTAPTNSGVLNPETSNAFEAGMKSEFFDRRLQLNAAAFTVTYDDFQANNFVLLNGGIITNLTNAGTVRSSGFEADIVAVPVDGLTLRASAAYADAKVVEFNPNPLTNAPDARNGTRLPFAPKFTYLLGASYQRVIGGLMLHLNTDFRHSGKQFSDLGEGGPLEAYGQWNAAIAISDPEDLYRLTFSVTNIMDESYVALNVGNGQRLQIARDADRFVGLTFRARIK